MSGRAAISLAAAALALLPGLGAQPASAHDSLVSASPSVSQVLKVVPKSVNLIFDDSVTNLAGANQIVVTDPKGRHLETGGTTVGANNLSTRLRVSAAVGRFKVLYRVLSADGHPVTGYYYFYIKK